MSPHVVVRQIGGALKQLGNTVTSFRCNLKYSGITYMTPLFFFFQSPVLSTLVLSAGLYTSVYPEDANPAGSSDHSQKKSERGPSNFCSPLAAFSERCFGALKRGASARDKELFTLASTAIILKLVVVRLLPAPGFWLRSPPQLH